MKKHINTSISIIIGTLIGAISFNCILVPNGLMAGGLGGIALVISKLTNLNIQLLLAALCLPIAIWAYCAYGIKPIITAISCFILFTAFLGVTNNLPVFKTDIMLATIVSGIMFGISGGVVLRLGCANGPESLIGLYFKNKFNLPMGTFFTIMNICIISTALIYSGLEIILYSFISIYITGKVTDFIVVGFRKYYEVSIVSDKYIEITDYIHNNLHRGATFIQCLGTYNLRKRMMIKTLVSNSEIVQLKNYSKSLDEDCFIFISQSNEVVGGGFTE